MKIEEVSARRIWDSRGRPTMEAVVRLQGGIGARGAAPAGASRGSKEAVELRDGGERLGGLGVERAVQAVREVIAPAIIGMDPRSQREIDSLMIEIDGTPNRSRLGGNATTAVSLAVFNAAAAGTGVPAWMKAAEDARQDPELPLPEIQIFGGGAHAQRRIDIQDLMVMAPGAANFEECLELTAEIYQAAGALMRERGRLAGVADEGGWWPDFKSNEEALETLVLAIGKAGVDAVISLDMAASELWSDGRYRLSLDGTELDSGGMLELLSKWIEAYPIVSIEDPFSEHDMEGMRSFTEAHGDRIQIVGDDCLVTNPARIRSAAKANACNAALLKVNQAGTLSETLDAHAAARAAGWRSIVSARSGETEDATISHLATGWGAGQLKVGSFARSERMAKWNECVRIQDEIGARAFAGGKPLSGTWWAESRRA